MVWSRERNEPEEPTTTTKIMVKAQSDGKSEYAKNEVQAPRQHRRNYWNIKKNNTMRNDS